MDKLDVWVFRHALSCNNLADKKGERVDFIKHLKNVGFTSCKHIPLTFGIVDLYIAIKE